MALLDKIDDFRLAASPHGEIAEFVAT